MYVEGAGNWVGAMALVAAMVAVAKPYEEYPEWDLLPMGVDLDDEDDIKAFQRLIDQGESTHEAMLAIVRGCDDPFAVSHALVVLRESRGDKRLVLEELREIFAEKLTGTGQADGLMLVCLAEALADIGKDAGTEVLAPMLIHPVWEVRSTGRRLLENQGGERTLEALESAKASNLGGCNPEDMDAIIQAIENRLAQNQGSLCQGKSDAEETENRAGVGQQPEIGGRIGGRKDLHD